MDASDWFVEALKASCFQDHYPAYTQVLGRLQPHFDRAVQVMAVSASGDGIRLHINPTFFQTRPQFLRGVLLHEVHHVVLGHVTHCGLQRVAFPDLMELAMEMSANEFIHEPLPGTPVTWEAFSALGIGAHQSTEERYELLAHARRSGKLAATMVRTIDDHGHFAGRSRRSQDAEERASPIVERIVAGLASQAPSASGPGAFVAGREPAALLALLRPQPMAPAAPDWRVELAAFFGSIRERAFTYGRPSRRFPDRIGQVPGRTRASRRQRLIVAIDTSASMDACLLAEIACQIRRIAALAEVTVAECDAAIHRVYAFRGHIDQVVGRGGTDLRPVFASDFLERHRPDAVVYFTDGKGPYPESDPRIPTLWVLSGFDGFACSWGGQIRLPVARARHGRSSVFNSRPTNSFSPARFR